MSRAVWLALPNAVAASFILSQQELYARNRADSLLHWFFRDGFGEKKTWLSYFSIQFSPRLVRVLIGNRSAEFLGEHIHTGRCEMASFPCGQMTAEACREAGLEVRPLPVTGFWTYRAGWRVLLPASLVGRKANKAKWRLIGAATEKILSRCECCGGKKFEPLPLEVRKERVSKISSA